MSIIPKGEAELRSSDKKKLEEERDKVLSELKLGHVENRPELGTVESLLNDAQSIQTGTQTQHHLMDYYLLLEKILRE